MPTLWPAQDSMGRSLGMSNAHPDVLALADELAPSNDDEGVAQVLERWF